MARERTPGDRAVMPVDIRRDQAVPFSEARVIAGRIATRQF